MVVNWYKVANDGWFGIDIPDDLPSEEEAFSHGLDMLREIEEARDKKVEELKSSGYKEYGGEFFQLTKVSIPVLSKSYKVDFDFPIDAEGGGTYEFDASVNYIPKLETTIWDNVKFGDTVVFVVVGLIDIRHVGEEGRLDYLKGTRSSLYTFSISVKDLRIVKGNLDEGLMRSEDFRNRVARYLTEALEEERSELVNNIIQSNARVHWDAARKRILQKQKEREAVVNKVTGR